MTDKPAPPRESWEALQRGPPPAPSASGNDDIMVANATAGGAGAQLLDWLRQEYIEHRDRVGATEAELRESEACRRLVRRLEEMRDRGLNAKAR